MPAKTKRARKAAGAALSVKRGKMPASKLKKSSKSMLKMSEEELRHFAKKKKR